MGKTVLLIIGGILSLPLLLTPLAPVVLVVWLCAALVPQLPKIRRAFDINGDGGIDFDDVKALFNPELRNAEPAPGAVPFLSTRVRKLWDMLEEKLALLSTRIQKRSRARSSWWRRFFSGKSGSRVDPLIPELVEALSDRQLANIRYDYLDTVDAIRQSSAELGEIQASMSMRGETEGGPLDRSRKKVEVKIGGLKQRQKELLGQFQRRMQHYEVWLSEEQAQVLLSRVDAGDISRMTTVFAVISTMTAQFAEAKSRSGENLSVTKRYYGMYIGLLEVQMHIQSRYIARVDGEYLPGVHRIGQEARNLLAETNLKLNASDQGHREGYLQNIQSQTFTIEVTDIYADALIADKRKVEEARTIVMKLHELAENTLSTVRISSDLASIIRQSESLYKQVMSLQTPALVPFENLEMQREFEAVTQRLHQNT